MPQSSLAKAYDDEETTALLQVLNNSKVSMAEGVQQLTKGGEAAISAKYELDDNKKLSLSVYTAEKGLGADPEHNVLKEFSGSPEKAPWAPEAEVFKDIPACLARVRTTDSDGIGKTFAGRLHCDGAEAA